jgi:predicted CXXCH cytochrome family protein
MPLVRSERTRRVVGPAALLVACAGVAPVACAGGYAPRPATAEVRPIRPLVSSNVERRDYAGSAACVPCHAEIAAAWEHSPMHRMTRDAPGADVQAPFDGTRWHFKDESIVLDRRGGERFIRIDSPRGEPVDYRVTRVLGGRTREDFVGVDARAGGEELVLPVSYVARTKALRYKGYSVMVHERDGLRAGPVWRQTCIFCHNTVPQLDRVLGAISAPRVARYQAEQVDRWLPVERRERTKVTDDGAFARAIEAETTRLGQDGTRVAGPSAAMAHEAIDVVRSEFDGRALVEVGIGCEACHGGAREHAADPRVRPSLVPVAPWLDVDLPVRREANGENANRAEASGESANRAEASGESANRAEAVNRVCAQCHQVLFSRYPFTWEGGRRASGAGGSHINSGEARDFLLGGCSNAMACTACHDPHGGGDPDAIRVLATRAGNATCTRCHTDLGDPNRLRAHAHHDPDGAAGSCVACHMPRKNMGLDGSLTRYHRIGSPTDPERVLGDRPLECALCHQDRSVRHLVEAMQAWWPVRYPPQRLEELYGSLDANVIRATLERGKPHEKAVAIATLGEAHARDAVAGVSRELLDEYPLIREWAKRALASILGRCDVDLAADDDEIMRQAVSSCGAPADGARSADTVRDRVPPGHPTADDDPED